MSWTKPSICEEAGTNIKIHLKPRQATLNFRSASGNLFEGVVDLAARSRLNYTRRGGGEGKLIAYAATTNLLSMLRIYIRGANLNFMETNFPASVNGVFPRSRGVDRGADYGVLRSRTIYAARPVSFSRNSLVNQERHATTITRLVRVQFRVVNAMIFDALILISHRDFWTYIFKI